MKLLGNRETRMGAWILMAVIGLAVVHATIATPQLFAQEAASGEVPPEQQQSTLMWIIHTSGLIGLFILILSIYFIALVVKLFLELREEVTAPPAVVQQCESLLQSRDVQGIYGMLQGDQAYFSQVLSTGLAELPHGLNEARDAAERQADALTVDMEKKISMLAVLGTLGPMIGLLGTLKGMIASFGVIARGGQMIKAAEVAGGISEALLLTFEGVLLSVPSIYFYAFFRNRVSTLSVNAQLLADDFLRKISRLMRSKSGPTTPAAR